MRENLKSIKGQRLRFTAKVVRFGERTAFKGPPIKTILLQDICLLGSSDILTDHLWFTVGLAWKGCQIGSCIAFDARVTEYTKGYKGHRNVENAPVQSDLKLSRPTNISVCFAGA